MALGQISLYYDLRLQIFTNINKQQKKTKNPADIKKKKSPKMHFSN